MLFYWCGLGLSSGVGIFKDPVSVVVHRVAELVEAVENIDDVLEMVDLEGGVDDLFHVKRVAFDLAVV